VVSEIERAVSKDWWRILHFVWHHHCYDTPFKQNAINCAKDLGISQVYIDYAVELGTFNKDFDLYIVPVVEG
jgi:hypothetical protein